MLWEKQEEFDMCIVEGMLNLVSEDIKMPQQIGRCLMYLILENLIMGVVND